MIASRTLDRYLTSLLEGQRRECRELLREHLDTGTEPTRLYEDMMWPAMQRIEQMFRDDEINTATEHMATRISRSLADQLQSHLPAAEPNGRRILIICDESEPEELGAQMCSDLFEASGWEVIFPGGGIPNDEILSLAGQRKPEILFIYGTRPGGVPGVRRLIDRLRETNVHPTMNVMLCGGVFNRAAGLWQEVNADLFAESALEALPMAAEAEPRKSEMRVPGAPKKRRRRRRPPLLAALEV